MQMGVAEKKIAIRVKEATDESMLKKSEISWKKRQSRLSFAFVYLVWVVVNIDDRTVR